MEGIGKNILEELNQLQLVITGLESENNRLKRDIARLQRITPISSKLMSQIEHLATQTERTTMDLIEEFMRLGLLLASEKFKNIPVTESVYRMFNRLAKGRLQPIATITTDEEFTNWVLYGFENEKF